MSSEVDRPAQDRPDRWVLFASAPGKGVIAVMVGLVTILAVAVAVVLSSSGSATGDPGQLTEVIRTVPDDVPLPVMSDVTREWGIDTLDLAPAQDRMAGGAAIADVNGDGAVELIVANGQVAVMTWQGSGYSEPRMLGLDAAIGVTAADVDRDGYADILVATAGDTDYVVWGGTWLDDGGAPAQSPLAAPGQSSALLAGELSGDSLTDIVRLGRGAMEVAEPDVLWTATAERTFVAVELPLPDRFSLAGELIDADTDGLLDIWITRDVGWKRGGDTVLSRQGNPTGEWVDIAADLGVALEVDGMGITLADVDGDATIDVYVSDLGDNELLLGTDDGFVEAADSGAAHIRPIDAGDDIVSSTWGTGALDINLDGVLDLVLVSGGFPVGTVSNKIDNTQIAVDEPPAVLLGLGDGTFANAWAALGLDLDVVGRGLSIGDLDQDGDDDIVLVDRRGPVHVLRNDTLGPSVAVSSVHGCGAEQVVTVRTDVGMFQRLVAPHSYASSHQAQLIVGNPTGGPISATFGDQSMLPQVLGPNPGRVQAELSCL